MPAAARPLKIAIVNYSSSGLFHYAGCLVNALAATDAEILFLTSCRNNLTLINQRANLTLFTQDAPHALPAFFAWFFNPREQWLFYQAIKQFRPDVIHLTDSHAIYVPHQWWLARYPILFTQHDPIVRQGDVYRLASRLIHRTQQRLASKIIVHGNFIKDILVAQGIAAHTVAVIPHGDYSFYQRWRKPDVKPIPNSVLFFGRVLDYKGLDILLRSIIELQQAGVPAHLIIAGAGDLAKYRSLLRQIPHQTIDNRAIPDEEVITYFQMSTLIALPYREASQSGIAAIAMPAGVPIVATKVGALPEILQDDVNSLLVEPRDVTGLTSALKRVLQDQHLRHRLAQGARQTVRTRLLWARTAQQYYQHYQSLL